MPGKTGPKTKAIVSTTVVSKSIVMLRHQKVIMDSVLAELYGVELKVMNQAVKRNIERFPSDFMIKLTAEEADSLRSQFVTLKNSRGKHSKYLPYAFTEQGVAMLSSILRSKRAIAVNIEIMRAFVQLRHILISDSELARKLKALEQKYDSRFKIVFDAIKALMTPTEPRKKRPIGFGPWEE